MTDEEKDLIQRAQDIQRYTENRCQILEERVAELKAQIEKMKCCYNCKHSRIYFVKEIIVDCLANKVNPNNKYENCDKWELAE